jgi:suppressor of G2 allele of SKP1
MAASALSIADSFFTDNLHLLALDAYTEAIRLTDEHHSSAIDTAVDRVALRFLALSHRSACYFALYRYKECYNDAAEALSLIDTNRYDFSKGDAGKLRYEQVAAAHHRAASSILALREPDCKEVARAHWESALTLAALGDNSALVDDYREKMAALATSHDSDERPIVEAAEKPIVEAVEKTDVNILNQVPSPVSPSASVPAASNSTQAPKYQYYQDSLWMKIQILESNLTASTCSVSITPTSLSVTVQKDGNSYNIIHGDLYENVQVDRCKTLYKEEKVLIKLKKVEEGEWHSLLDGKKKKKVEELPSQTQNTSNQHNHNKSMSRPYASTKDWNAIDRSLKAEEEKETPQGEEALNALFKQIYENANEDTRRAMVKSMQTSGGTVLSTNWEEVEKADYEKERVAPKGMEWKNYEGDKLSMKDDD